ncbi:MAG: D-2-hydroxyacid dehydrogenase [Tissierellia bacterium]|nr:D-2-hydroxyacid dehydrogenase [Tissierellia bacterium]MDD4780033.1 D-2-hydroxyacid dehydrogenase [Tissierellia bacterium]
MNIIVIKPYIEILRKNFPDIKFYKTDEECTDASAIIGLPNDFTKEILEKHPNIKWIQGLLAGYDMLDLDYFKQRKITYTNAKDIFSVPIAEDVICKILIHNTNALKYINNKNQKIWQGKYKRRELFGQTVGIIGTGSIATEVAKRLQGFGVKVIGYKRTPVISLPYFEEIYTGKKGMNDLMLQSDYLVITVDLNKDTYHMINKDNLKLMKKNASIINIARGSVINEEDLIESLKNGDIDYVGLDVFEQEPLPLDSEIWNLENVYMTPHTSGTVENIKDKFDKLIVENVQRFIDNETLANVVK